LWKHLKSNQLEGRKFRRQHSIENFIVDFYCASEKLVIELDGQVHFNEEAQKYDKARQRQIELLGFTVLRFENKMVFDLLASVLLEIKEKFKK
jgi:very-short-patch-repair endonuclease